MTVTFDVWHVAGTLALFSTAIAYLVGLSWRQRSSAAAQLAHEREDDQRFAQLVKVGDERHTETRAMFEAVRADTGRLDTKIDRLLERG